MSLTRRVARNTLIQVAGKIITVAMGVVVVGMMTRALGPEGYGYYTTTVAFLQIFAIVIDFGFALTTVQFLADPRYEPSAVLRAMLGLRLVTVIPCLALAVIVGWFMPYPFVVKMGIAILSIEFLAISLFQILTGLFQKELHMERVAVAEIIGRVFLLLGTIVAVRLNAGLLPFFIAITLAAIVNCICIALFARRFARIRPTIDTALWKAFIATSWPIGISIACNLLYLKGDTFVLSLYRSPEEVGLYGAPYRVLEILAASPYLFVGIVFPLLRSAWLSDKVRFHRMLQKSFDALVLIAAPIVAGAMVLSVPLMTLVAGNAFAPSGAYLRILAIATGFIFIGTLFGHVVLVIEKQRPMIWGYAVGAVIALAGYFIFIPRYGAVGAAWMTVVVEAFIALTTFAVSWKVAHYTPSLRIAGKAVIASIIMAATIAALPSVHVLTLVALGAITYSIMILLLRGISRDMIRTLLP